MNNKGIRVHDYISRCKLGITGLFLIISIHSLIYFSLTLIFKVVYEDFIDKPKPGGLSHVFFVVILVSIVGITLFSIGNQISANLKNKFRRMLRGKLMNRLLDARYKSFMGISGGEMVNILIPETDTVSEALLQICKAWIYVIQIIVFLILLGFLDRSISILFAGVILIDLMLMNLVKKRVSGIHAELSETRDKNYNFFYSYMQSIKEIKCYNLAAYQSDIYRDIAAEERKKNMRLTRNMNILKLFSELPLIICMIILYVWGFFQLKSELISFGYLLTFIGFVSRFGFMVTQLSASLSFLQTSKPAFAKVQKLLEIPCETRQGESLDGTIGQIEINGLSFSYNAKTEIIRNLDLSIDRNSFICIVGETGSGKSTIIDLIMRLFCVNDGNITIDGKEINRINPDSIREKIGIISQTGIILQDTLRKNIDLKDTLSDAEVLNICKDVGLGDLLEKLPSGINTEISAQGMNLSGGENQRILIARCLAKSTNFCILDEATSALDYRSERKIIETLVRLRKKNRDFTVIAITHRPSFSKYSDIIYVLRDGRIAEVGTHDELKENNSYYSTLFACD